MVAIDKSVVRQEEANSKCKERMTTLGKPIIKIAFLVLLLHLHKFKVSIAVVAHSEPRWGLLNLKTTKCATKFNCFEAENTTPDLMGQIIHSQNTSTLKNTYYGLGQLAQWVEPCHVCVATWLSSKCLGNRDRRSLEQAE